MRWLHTSLLYSCVLAVDYTHDWPLYRAAFGSCNKQDKPQPLWPVIGAAAPQLWLWTGDAVYAHGSAAALARAVDRQRRNANYSAFAKGVVVDGAWDDHDLGVNDAGRGRAEERRGVYGSRRFGPPGRRATVLLLDTRSFRDDYLLPSWNVGSWCFGIPVLGRLAPLAAAALRLVSGLLDLPRRADFGGDVLGEAQWAWLERELLDARDSSFVVVPSSVQVLTSNPTFESWAHFPKAKRRLLALLYATNASGVALLSGDVHHAEVAAPAPGPVCGDVVEVTSSGLTHAMSTSAVTKLLFPPLLRYFHAHRPEPGAYYADPNFGRLDFDWEARTMTVSARDGDGAAVLAAEVRACRARPPAAPRRPGGEL
ncbi:hypothetical protein JL720_6424 [Aureococcus anophagefferens]|nr:hypothetical protein JL720_6424 [Aureococcus anophagefferens]